MPSQDPIVEERANEGAPQTVAAAPVRPHTQRFRRASNAVNLTADQRRRQATAMQHAWIALGSREAVMAFFNELSDVLGGRPLDLAVDSDEGLARVVALLHARSADDDRRG